jgi:hypothetical protein
MAFLTISVVCSNGAICSGIVFVHPAGAVPAFATASVPGQSPKGLTPNETI